MGHMPPAKRAARKARRSYHHGNLRRALLDEALATIRDKGVEGLTLREIGARLGVSRSALYRHFADKRALLTTVATEAVGAFQALVDAVAAMQREGIVREDDTVLMARYMWAVVHGVAMLAIDGQLPEPGGVEELTQYALERLGTGIG